MHRRSSRSSVLVAAFAALTLVAELCLRPPLWLVRLVAWRTSGVVFFADTDVRIVALSLDDGPDPWLTPRLLDVLARHSVHATCFVLGRRADANRAVLNQIVQEGHELGNHTWDDTPGWRLSPDELWESLRRTSAVLAAVAPVRLFRPGSGWVDQRMLAIARRLGYRCVLGSVYPLDGRVQLPRYARWDVLRRVRPGAIIVLHEGSRRRDRVEWVLDELVVELRRRGYEVTTVSRLIEAAAAAPPSGS